VVIVKYAELLHAELAPLGKAVAVSSGNHDLT
jgi:hypothetical protein